MQRELAATHGERADNERSHVDDFVDSGDVTTMRN